MSTGFLVGASTVLWWRMATLATSDALRCLIGITPLIEVTGIP